MTKYIAPELAQALAIPRPRTRAECLEEARPCPWVGCKHHLALDVVPADRENTRRRANVLVLAAPSSSAGRRRGLAESADTIQEHEFFDAVVDRLVEMSSTCALDVADGGKRSPAEVAELLRITSQEVRRIFYSARRKQIALAAHRRLQREMLEAPP